jgi:hypothetical protein
LKKLPYLQAAFFILFDLSYIKATVIFLTAIFFDLQKQMAQKY